MGTKPWELRSQRKSLHVRSVTGGCCSSRESCSVRPPGFVLPDLLPEMTSPSFSVFLSYTQISGLSASPTITLKLSLFPPDRNHLSFEMSKMVPLVLGFIAHTVQAQILKHFFSTCHVLYAGALSSPRHQHGKLYYARLLQMGKQRLREVQQPICGFPFYRYRS